MRGAQVGVDREDVLTVAAQRRAGQDLDPSGSLELARVGIDRCRARLERARLGIVAAEERGVDDHAAHDPRGAQAQDAPVVARFAPAPGLPAVHPLAAIGVLALAPHRGRLLDQVLLGREEVVVGGEDGAAQSFGGEVRKRQEVGHRVSSVPLGAANAPLS